MNYDLSENVFKMHKPVDICCSSPGTRHQKMKKLTYPYVMAGQDVVKPFVEIAISGEAHIVKHWTAAQNC